MKLKYINILVSSLLTSSLLGANIEHSVDLNISTFSSEVKEIVYTNNGGRKLSELTWEANNIKMLGIGYSVNFNKFFKINLNYKRNYSTGNGMMNDYDWLDSSNANTWSDWSTHPNTEVDLVEHIDINFEKNIFDSGTNKVNLSLGYKEENTKYSSYDGSYIYSSSGVLRDQVGTFSGKVISYEHDITMPYAKIDYEYNENEFKLFAGISYSPKVTINDLDTHHSRNLQFEDSFSDATYKGFNVGIEYRNDKSLSFDVEYNKAIYEEISGNTKVTNLINGASNTYGGAGFSQEYDMLAFSITKIF